MKGWPRGVSRGPQSLEHRAKISARNKQRSVAGLNDKFIFSARGKSLSAEHVAKIQAAHPSNDPLRREAFIEKCRANGVKSRQTILSRAPWSCAEHYVRGFLSALGVDFVWQAPLEGALVDFYIPSMRLVLEYDGTYWHSRTGVRDRDERQNERLEAAGYMVVRMTEKTMDVVLRETFVTTQKEAVA